MLLGRMNSPEAINIANSQRKMYDTMLLLCSIVVRHVSITRFHAQGSPNKRPGEWHIFTTTVVRWTRKSVRFWSVMNQEMTWGVFSALTLSVGWHEGHLVCKIAWVVWCWSGYLSGARCRLAYGPADATTSWCHTLHLASVISRLVLPLWYQLIWSSRTKGC